MSFILKWISWISPNGGRLEQKKSRKSGRCPTGATSKSCFHLGRRRGNSGKKRLETPEEFQSQSRRVESEIQKVVSRVTRVTRVTVTPTTMKISCRVRGDWFQVPCHEGERRLIKYRKEIRDHFAIKTCTKWPTQRLLISLKRRYFLVRSSPPRPAPQSCLVTTGRT